MNKWLSMAKGRISWILVCVVVSISLQSFGTMNLKAAASYPYFIKVNKQQNCVTIYKKDSAGKYTVPIKAMVCSTGWDTPVGTFRTPQKYRWKLLMGDVWGQYSTRIHKGVLFHSVWYYKKDPSTLSATQYNKLGTTCSHGCVRLTVSDAKWIYDNCPVGTTVQVYNSKVPGPLGKPVAAKLPSGTGWDPTDIWNLGNPFLKQAPIISGVKNQKVKYGGQIDVRKGVTAKTSTGIVATNKMKVSVSYGKTTVPSINTKKPGTYKVTYHLVDPLGKKVKKTATITVLKRDEPPKIVGVKDLVVKKGTAVNRSFVMKNVMVTQNGKKLSKDKVKVSIKKVGTYEYKVVYTVTNGKKTTEEAYVIVDTEAPLIYGVKDREIPADAVVEDYVLKGITVADDISILSLKNLKVSTVDNGDGSYTITYTLKDEVGYVKKEVAVFTRALPEEEVVSEEVYGK